MYVQNVFIYEYHGTLEEFVLKYIPSEVKNNVYILDSKEINFNTPSTYKDEIVVIKNLENEKNIDLLPFLRAINNQNVLVLICTKNICRLKKVYAQEWGGFISMLSYIQSDKECVFYGATGKKG